MPIYEYVCTGCGYKFDMLQKVSEPTIESCPQCGLKNGKRIISMSSFRLKGGGWFEDGYVKKKG
jgi:putative FmdB family regulatory protein